MLTLSAFLINGISKLTQSKPASTSSPLPSVLFVLGGPGAGKGTQCLKLVKNFRFVHLSAGDLLRAEQNCGSKDGELIQHYIREGRIVPVEITVRLIEKAMNDNPGREFLIDGFPRSDDNLKGWQSHMNGKADVKAVLLFDCPEEICVKRILERAKTSGRIDDNEESLRKRFRTFYSETLPVITYFEEQGLVRRISAIPEPEEVYERVKIVLKNL